MTTRPVALYLWRVLCTQNRGQRCVDELLTFQIQKRFRRHNIILFIGVNDGFFENKIFNTGPHMLIENLNVYFFPRRLIAPTIGYFVVLRD